MPKTPPVYKNSGKSQYNFLTQQNLKPNIISGAADLTKSKISQTYGNQNLIQHITTHVDGNYKTELVLDTIQGIWFKDFRAGLCDHNNPGVALLDQSTVHPRIIIDLAVCMPPAEKYADNFLSSIEILNRPLEIFFSLIETDESEFAVASYAMEIATNYAEDYIIDFHTQSGLTNQLAVNHENQLETIDENLQFDFNSYHDENYQMQTSSGKSISPAGQVTYLEIAPMNGFYPGKMVPIPELCTITNVKTDEFKFLWDLSSHNDCVDDLNYEINTGTWQFALNMAQEFNEYNSNDFLISCNMRVCTSVVGNECQPKIDQCRYEKSRE